MRLRKTIVLFLIASLLTSCGGYKRVKKVRKIPKKVAIEVTPTPEFSIPATDENIYFLAKWIYSECKDEKDEFLLEFTGVSVIKMVKLGKAKSIKDAVGEFTCEPDERCMEVAEGLLRYNVERSFPDELSRWKTWNKLAIRK